MEIQMAQKSPTLRQYLQNYSSRFKSKQEQKILLSPPPLSHSQLLTEKIGQIKRLLNQKLSEADYKKVESTLQDVQDLFFLQSNEMYNLEKSQINVRSTVGRTTRQKLKTHKFTSNRCPADKDNKQNQQSSNTSMSFNSDRDQRKELTNTTEISFIKKPYLQQTWKIDSTVKVNNLLLGLPEIKKHLSDDESLRDTKKSAIDNNFLCTF